MKAFTSTNELAAYITESAGDTSPYIIAVGGFGGSGKSTLCKSLANLLTDCGIVPVDDFIIYPHAPNVFDHDWKSFEDKVLKNIRTEPRVETKIYDWKTDSPVSGNTAPVRRFMLLDGLRMLQPALAHYMDLKIWIDCPHDVSMERGKRRDRYEQGNEHDDLWDNIWGPAELRFLNQFRPDQLADVLFRTDQRVPAD